MCHFFVLKNPNEPTKSSLIVEKFAQSGHPNTDEQTDGQTDGRTDRRTDGRTAGQTDGQTDGRTDGQTTEF